MRNQRKRSYGIKRDSGGSLTVAGRILLTLLTGVAMLPKPFESKTSYVKRLFAGPSYGSIKTVMTTIERLQRSGLLKVYKEDSVPVVKLTHAGQLQALFIKANTPGRCKSVKNQYCLVMFDIPENDGGQLFRDELRFLLKQNGFKQIQKSVFVSCCTLGPDAILYLKETKLIKYIRVFEVKEVDDGGSLASLFKKG